MSLIIVQNFIEMSNVANNYFKYCRAKFKKIEFRI